MLRGIALALTLVLGVGIARADDVDVEVRNKVAQKEGLPALILHVNAKVAQVEINLDGGGKTLHFTAGPFKPGASKRFSIDPGAGPVDYTGSLTVKYPPKEGKDAVTLELHFTAEVIRPLVIHVEPADVDLEHGQLQLTANHVLGQVEVTVFGEDGAELSRSSVQAKGAQVGTKLPVSWKVPSAKVLKLHLQVTDVDGFFAGEDFFPWRVDVPHQDVSFPSGSSGIPPGESNKLDEALAQILPQIARARAFAEIHLYVVGHTDTVGGDATNQKLSEERAHAIAGYFRAHGVAIPILYTGLGEKALAVQTADEVDEPRNRRAEYVLSVGEPGIAHAATAPTWKKL